jgi:hypothetical protein
VYWLYFQHVWRLVRLMLLKFWKIFCTCTPTMRVYGNFDIINKLL